MRGRVLRELRSVVLGGAVEPGTTLATAQGEVAGVLTSVASSPKRGWIGLGYLNVNVTVPTVFAGERRIQTLIQPAPAWPSST